ncbi:MAG: hypothetical protein FWD93_04160 [Coriobacteriia bacterium]|nr:hypothetical protein [Coriobacteriia bacterium]
MELSLQKPNTKLFESLGELIAPTRCAGCEKQGALLCPECLSMLNCGYHNTQACPNCAGPYGALTCTECWDINYGFARALALGILDGPLARAVVLFKDANERRLAQLLGHLLAKCIQSNWLDWIDNKSLVTWVPASNTAIRKRGFDHAKLLAFEVAKTLGLPAISTLSRARARDQRGLKRRQRLEDVEQFYCLLTPQVDTQNFGKSAVHPPSKILLIDDVFTTGATAEKATKALLEAGILEVRVAVLGRAW